MSFPSTKELMIRLRNGDEETFEEIYNEYWGKLYKLCLYYTRSKEDSEDMVIAIFMSLWDNRDKVEIENLSSYLVKAAKNQSIKYILKQEKRRQQLQLMETKAATFPNWDNCPDKILELKELNLNINNQVELLSERTKRIFILNRENGLTYQEIARSMGISVKSVEYHISKALHVLGKYLVLLVMFLFLA